MSHPELVAVVEPSMPWAANSGLELEDALATPLHHREREESTAGAFGMLQLSALQEGSSLVLIGHVCFIQFLAWSPQESGRLMGPHKSKRHQSHQFPSRSHIRLAHSHASHLPPKSSRCRHPHRSRQSCSIILTSVGNWLPTQWISVFSSSSSMLVTTIRQFPSSTIQKDLFFAGCPPRPWSAARNSSSWSRRAISRSENLKECPWLVARATNPRFRPVRLASPQLAAHPKASPHRWKTHDLPTISSAPSSMPPVFSRPPFFSVSISFKFLLGNCSKVSALVTRFLDASDGIGSIASSSARRARSGGSCRAQRWSPWRALRWCRHRGRFTLRFRLILTFCLLLWTLDLSISDHSSLNLSVGFHHLICPFTHWHPAGRRSHSKSYEQVFKTCFSIRYCCPAKSFLKKLQQVLASVLLAQLGVVQVRSNAPSFGSQLGCQFGSK